MLITHDLGVVAEMADEVVVMYAGKVVERADVRTVFGSPHHPYTQGLLRSIPRIDEQRERLEVIKGTVPVAAQPADRLPVQAALPEPHARVRHGAALPGGRAGPLQPLLADPGRRAPGCRR